MAPTPGNTAVSSNQAKELPGACRLSMTRMPTAATIETCGNDQDCGFDVLGRPR